jgi:glutamyl-tRNA reductase
VSFEEFADELKNTDLFITATGSKKPIIDVAMIEPILAGRTGKDKLVIVDVANPRDVHPKVGALEGVDLLNIDNLKSVAEKNLKKRMKEVYLVEELIEEEISLLEKNLYHVDVDNIIQAVFMNAEDIRGRELEKAITMLGNGIGEKEKEVINKLTKVIVKKTMTPIAKQIRKVAEIDDKDSLRAAEIYFLQENS